jgi:hypothetical protein
MDLYDYSLWSIFVAGLTLIIVATEIGLWFGIRATKESGNITTLTGSILGLLALMIGFTFSMTLSRFEARREGVLIEANAIGTAALRARLLPEPQRSETLKLMREYVKIRLDLTNHVATRAELAATVDRSSAVQELMWQQVKTLAAADKGMVPTGQYIQSLNDMIDSQGKRLSAVRNMLPADVLLLLFGIAAVASAFSGYGSASGGRKVRAPVYVTGFLVSVVILLILDLDRPNAGFILVSQQPMVDTAASIDSFRD